jgi:DNA-binding protein H-NS
MNISLVPEIKHTLSNEDVSVEQIQKALGKAKSALMEAEQEEWALKIYDILKIVRDNKIPFEMLLKTMVEHHAIYSQNGRTSKLYVHSNPKNTPWSGFGRPPKWLRDKVAKGVDIEKYAVEVVLDSKHEIRWFYNPERPTQRWNGFGCHPIWYRELEARNVDMSQYQTTM